tara:strand:- start:40 stop:582 length:543 start_codon:yes stop_codon:yes gene_type:complete
MKKIIKSFLKEIVPIILGILIAMYINNWNENTKDKKYINQILSSINKELKETNEDIKKELSFQKTLIDSLNFYKNDDKISIFDVMIKADGIHMPSIKISSWQAISRSRIELMKYDRISALASIEEQKELLESKTEHLINFLYPNIKETGIDNKELIILMMQDIIATERGLQEKIKEIVKD